MWVKQGSCLRWPGQLGVSARWKPAQAADNGSGTGAAGRRRQKSSSAAKRTCRLLTADSCGSAHSFRKRAMRPSCARQSQRRQPSGGRGRWRRRRRREQRARRPGQQLPTRCKTEKHRTPRTEFGALRRYGGQAAAAMGVRKALRLLAANDLVEERDCAFRPTCRIEGPEAV